MSEIRYNLKIGESMTKLGGMTKNKITLFRFFRKMISLKVLNSKINVR